MSLDQLPVWAQELVVFIKEAGAIGLAILVVAFYLAQQAGWVGNVDRLDHKDIVLELQRQTIVLVENQRIVKELVITTNDNQRSFTVLARGICLSVTQTKDIEARCLAGTH